MVHTLHEIPYFTKTLTFLQRSYEYSHSLELYKALSGLIAAQAGFCHQRSFCHTFAFWDLGILVLWGTDCISRLPAFRLQVRERRQEVGRAGGAGQRPFLFGARQAPFWGRGRRKANGKLATRQRVVGKGHRLFLHFE